jgi:hypothetical protein
MNPPLDDELPEDDLVECLEHLASIENDLLAASAPLHARGSSQ